MFLASVGLSLGLFLLGNGHKWVLLFPHISPISRTRGHRRRLPFPYHRYIQKTQTKEEKERKKITDEKTSPDLIGGEGKK